MHRYVALATFVVALVLVVACGAQITPNPTNSNLAGDIDLRFRVNGTLAFSTYDYQIVIDTCAQGVPYPNPASNSYKAYTFSFNIGTSPFGIATVYPILIQYKLTTGTGGFVPLPVTVSPSLVTLNTNSNGQGSEFELIFPRALLDDPLDGTNPPCSGITQPSSSSRTVAPAAAAAATTAPTPAASASPGAIATTAAQATWIMNFIVLTPAGVPVDSLGSGGPTDNSYPGILVNTQQLQPQPVNKQTDISGAPTDPNASIAGGEVDNYP
jgi:hypothetical protein